MLASKDSIPQVTVPFIPLMQFQEILDVKRHKNKEPTPAQKSRRSSESAEIAPMSLGVAKKASVGDKKAAVAFDSKANAASPLKECENQAANY